jgi:hypothetical protein
MDAPKLHPDDLGDSDFREMEELISAAAGGAPVSIDGTIVAHLIDIFMPRGATAPAIDDSTAGKLRAVLWPDGVPPDATLTTPAADVQSMLADWHLLH